MAAAAAAAYPHPHRASLVIKAGYWRSDIPSYPPSSIDFSSFTHILYAFVQPDPTSFNLTITSADDTLLANFTATLHSQHPPLKALLSIGGGGSDSSFANIASTRSNRLSFITSTIAVARHYNLDGLDLDWEFPINPTEMSNLGDLYTEWRHAFEKEAARTRRPRLLLTSAVYFASHFFLSGTPRSYPSSAMSKSLDWLNIMCYDYHGGWDTSETGVAAMAGKTMRAVHYDGYGGGAAALKQVEVPIPSPKKGEVLLKVEAAAINPVDWKIQKGLIRPFLPPKFPFVPVTDIAGEVIEVGSAVQKFKPGDKVVSILNSFGGGLAEYAIAPVNLTVNRPPEVSAAEGAGLPIAALTALQALKSGGAKFDTTGEPLNVLITAASGGVGHYAVQLAKLGNHHVTATCGARNITFVKDLGADEVLDYKTPEGASLKSPSGRTYDSVIHCTTGISWSTFEPNLSANGKVIDITPSPSTMFSYVVKKLTWSKKQLVPLLLIPKGEDLGFLVELVKVGKLKTVVDSRFPLSDAEAAWAKSIDGHATGKIIVEM